jgi:hypothetical protein
MLRIGYAQSDGRVGPLGHMTPPPGANDSPSVMAALVPAIHVFLAGGTKDVDARREAGHDDRCGVSGRTRHREERKRRSDPEF